MKEHNEAHKTPAEQITDFMLSQPRGKQGELAELAGVERKTLYNIMKGRNKPNLYTVRQIERGWKELGFFIER